MPNTATAARSLVLRDHEVQMARKTGRVQVWRPLDRIAGMGRIREFQVSDTPGYDWIFRDHEMRWNDLRNDGLLARSPFGVPGSKRWVKETWKRIPPKGECPGGYSIPGSQFYDRVAWYRADNDDPTWSPENWRSSIHLPRWASRLTVELTDVRPLRVQDASEEDAKAAGATRMHLDDLGQSFKSYRRGFQAAWDAIWEDNLWMWAGDYRVVEDTAKESSDD